MNQNLKFKVLQKNRKINLPNKTFLMAKKQNPDPISEDIKRLNELRVLKVIEKTDIYDKEINELKSKIDYYYYGITLQCLAMCGAKID